MLQSSRTMALVSLLLVLSLVFSPVLSTAEVHQPLVLLRNDQEPEKTHKNTNNLNTDSRVSTETSTKLASNSSVDQLNFSKAQQRQQNTRNLKSLGLDTVEQHSGYIDFEEKHMFYYFVESRNNPKTDPVLLWLNGGPGCSSMTSLLFENGPSILNSDLEPVYNPYSWNSNASVIYLDQPIGVGFSYGDYNVSSTYEAAKDVYSFLQVFFERFPGFATNEFHLSGYSYAGHYVPAIASEIINHDDSVVKLTSIMIGNPMTDPLVQEQYYHPMVCGPDGGVDKLLDDETCDQMVVNYPHCKELVEECYSTNDDGICLEATEYCSAVILEPFANAGVSYYDVRTTCEKDALFCYKAIDNAELYLNREEVMKNLGSEVGKFHYFNDNVRKWFHLTGDNSKPSQGYISELLNKGYPVLIYAGDKDYVCNWLGNLAWTNELEWKYGGDYKAEELKPWLGEGGEKLGEVKNFGNFTFVRVYDAGHIAPHDQPKALSTLAISWINGNYSLEKHELKNALVTAVTSSLALLTIFGWFGFV